MAGEDTEIKFARVGSLKEGSYVLIDGSVCQIKSVEKSKGGKHGAAKARIVGIDIFTGQKKNLMKPTTSDTEVPIIKRGTGQVVAIMGDQIKLMDVADYSMWDVPRPKDVTGLSSGVEVEYIRYGKDSRIVRKKSAS